MPLLKESDRKTLKEEFEKTLKGDVKLVVFTSGASACRYCRETVMICEEIAELSDKITVEKYDISTDAEAAREWGVENAPTILVMAGDGTYRGRIRFTGIPSGYEFISLVEDIKMVSSRDPGLKPSTVEALKEIEVPIHIRVFVTPTCPYCPRAVTMAHKFAMASERITGEMVEAIEFPEMANRWNVMSVPHVVINEDVQFVGALPEEEYLKEVLKAATASRP